MKKLRKIIIREILTVVLALLLVMAAGILIDESPEVQLRNINKFKIELKN